MTNQYHENLTAIIVPTLSVNGGASAIEFYKKAFGAVVLMSNTDLAGSIVAEMSIGGARLVVAD